MKEKIKKIKFFKDYKKEIKNSLSDLRVIYSDLDGTLLNDKGCLIKDVCGNYFFGVVRLFKEIAKNGWDIVLASGRNKLQLKYNAMLLSVKNYIPELGCEMVYDFGEKVYTTFDLKKFNYEITRGGKDLIKIIEILKKEFPGKIESLLEWSMERTYNALLFGDINLEKANKLLIDNGFGGLSLEDNGYSNLVNLNLNVENLRIYNLVPKGVHKSSAIIVDKKVRNFTKNQCIALGDSISDLKMAEEVKYFFLMRDSIEKDIKIIDKIINYENVFITTGKMNRGWAEVIRYLAY